MAFAILIFLYLLQSCNLASSESFIGVNYGQVADNLPSPSATAKLLQSTAVQKVRLYGADPAIIRALANTGIGIVIGAANGEIPALASDPNFATQWINSNVLTYYPASKIILITVGNEVLLTNDQNLISQLLPAMQNMQRALSSASLGGKVKVSTVHSMAILSRSDPPSSGLFNPAYQDTMRRLLQFQKDNGSPLAVNPYPFFAYQSDARPETLAFCLFQPNPGRVDSGNGIKYMNMFDAQVDAVRSALNAMGFIDVEIVVAETGWPYKGDSNEVGPGIENARAYNGNLVAHLRSMVGTPLMPGKSVDTYIFALYDEDLKSGPASERSFGLLKPDLSVTYDIGLLKSSLTPSTPTTPVTPSPKPTTAGWCVPKAGVSDAQLQASLDYACGQGIDCGPIQPGGACFEPNTVASHASYAMNLYYQKSAKNPWNCDFSETATLTLKNPSKSHFNSNAISLHIYLQF
ncbi:glucan endo-1,3-beta-glucosidase 7-like [Populus alba x Populus x berolinensis]|nr:glucan endo-1,3-beta-glucosidase 7-like [Populus alba x Populus x berolinensis]